MSIPEIISGSIYFGIGLIFVITFKDIYYSFIVVIVEIGLLYMRKNYSITVICFNIITTLFSFVSIVITIFKYKKKVFGLAHIDWSNSTIIKIFQKGLLVTLLIKKLILI